MQVFGLSGCFARLSKYSSIELEELSEKARLKYQVLDLLRKSGDVRLTSDHYGISRATIYRWKKQFNPKDPHSLEERSKRPHRFRMPQWSKELEDEVKGFRESFGWGKDKLAVLVRREGHQNSTRTVDRILRYLKRTGKLTEALHPKDTYLSRWDMPSPSVKWPKSFPKRLVLYLCLQIPESYIETRNRISNNASVASLKNMIDHLFP